MHIWISFFFFYAEFILTNFAFEVLMTPLPGILAQLVWGATHVSIFQKASKVRLIHTEGRATDLS